MAELMGRLHKHGVMVTGETGELERSFFGKPALGGLQLCPVEALYLVEKGKLAVEAEGRRLSATELIDHFTKLDPDFSLKYAVYSDLRSRGYIVRTGLKFGAHFRVYERGEKPGEAHSKYIVQAVPEWIKLTPTDFARGVRLARSVRKGMLFGVVDDEGDVTYYSLMREKP
ncbi:MAG: tRNA-intron lyase [Candidatus Hadarchaeales archaeon]